MWVRKFILALFFLFLSVQIRGAVLDVCSTCTYTHPSTADAAASANDIIEFQGNGTYNWEWEPDKIITVRIQDGTTWQVTWYATGVNDHCVNLDNLDDPNEGVTILGEMRQLTMYAEGGQCVNHTGSGGFVHVEEVDFQGSDNFNRLVTLDGIGEDSAHVFKACLFDGNDIAGTEALYHGGINNLNPSLKCQNNVWREFGGDTAAINIYAVGVTITGGIVAEFINETIGDCGNSQPALRSDESVTVINCLFPYNDNDITFSESADRAAISYSAFGEDDASGMGTGAITVNSADEVTSTSDFHLKAGADSIDAGTDTSGYGVTTDHDGNSRSGTYDIGAYEYIAAEETPTTTSTPTSTPTDTPTDTETSTKTDTKTATNTATPTLTKSITLTATSTDTPTLTKSITLTATETATPTLTKSITLTATRTSTNTNTPTLTKSITLTATPTDTPTLTKSITLTATTTSTPTLTKSITLTATKTSTSTSTPTLTKSMTLTATPTSTPTLTKSITPTATPTATPTLTKSITTTATKTATSTSTPTITKTITKTATNTSTPTITKTITKTATRTSTSTSTPTITKTATKTATETSTSTSTPTITKTSTKTATKTNTNTATPTITKTATRTSTRTSTSTSTPTNTPTATPTVTPTVTETNTPTAQAKMQPGMYIWGR